MSPWEARSFSREKFTRAVDATKAALQAIRIEDDPRLYLRARYNLARYLTEDGQYRGAVAALMLFQEAAWQEQLTVREYAKYLQEARTDPSLRFGQAQPS